MRSRTDRRPRYGTASGRRRWNIGSGEAPPLVAVLEGLNDHENIGALFRNAAAFGVAGVLLDPTCADRSTAGRSGYPSGMSSTCRSPGWCRGRPGSTRCGPPASSSAVLAPRPAADGGVPAVSLAELKAWMSGSDHPVGVALLLGAEGPGLTDTALAASDVVVHIPMVDRVDSLNVATAAAVAFHVLAGL